VPLALLLYKIISSSLIPMDLAETVWLASVLLVMIPGLVAVLVVLARAALWLPAVAVDDLRGLGDLWRCTRERFGRLLLIMISLHVILFVFIFLFSQALSFLGDMLFMAFINFTGFSESLTLDLLTTLLVQYCTYISYAVIMSIQATIYAWLAGSPRSQ